MGKGYKRRVLKVIGDSLELEFFLLERGEVGDSDCIQGVRLMRSIIRFAFPEVIWKTDKQTKRRLLGGKWW